MATKDNLGSAFLAAVFMLMLALIIVMQLTRIPTLVGYGCDVGHGPDDKRTIYANAEDDFTKCDRIERW